MTKYALSKKIYYVVATMSSPTMYMRAIPIRDGGGYAFMKKIEQATKVKNAEDAQWLAQDYKTGECREFAGEVVVVPIEVTYEILDVQDESLNHIPTEEEIIINHYLTKGMLNECPPS